MNSTIKILTFIIAVVISSVLFPKQAAAQQSNVSFQVFYDQLSPYGQWVDYPNYGYVWIPDVGPDFVPYSSRGHWIMTDYGWTWVSDYDWGWAPFHYGRWDYDNYYGWLWVPDNEWGPSWVIWRRADGYYGWSPMEPGVSISVSFGRAYNNHSNHWMFVRDRDIDRSDINRYYVNRTDHDRIVRSSTVINKTYMDNRRHTTYVYGPAREDVQRVTGRKVNSVTIQENNKPGQNLGNGQLRIYRPQVAKNNGSGQKPTPTRITNLKNVKRSSERNATDQSRNVNPQDNRKDQQQKASIPANTNRKAQPAQQQNTKPAENNRRVQQQPNAVKPPENNKPQPVQPQKANPANNNGRERQPNAVRPQNNNNQVQPTPPQNTKPAENNRRMQQQPNAVKPPENNKPQPVQPQRANPANNNGRERQPNTVKPQNNKGNEQPKESKPEPGRRKRN